MDPCCIGSVSTVAAGFGGLLLALRFCCCVWISYSTVLQSFRDGWVYLFLLPLSLIVLSVDFLILVFGIGILRKDIKMYLPILPIPIPIPKKRY